MKKVIICECTQYNLQLLEKKLNAGMALLGGWDKCQLDWSQIPGNGGHHPPGTCPFPDPNFESPGLSILPASS